MAEIIELPQACQLVRQYVGCNGPEELTLDRTLGCVLAEDIVASVDSPPHDKSMVDGFAVIAADLPDGKARLAVIEDICAGQVPKLAICSGQAARIMTGAVLPAGADAVVMIEQTRGAGVVGDWVEIDADRVAIEQNVTRRGAVMCAGVVVLPRGQRVRPIEVGILAEAGRGTAQVVRPPRVATIQTGDELVDVHKRPGPGQIRNSNGPLLKAMLRQAGAIVDDLGIVRDHAESLQSAIQQGLAADVLVLSGGVSQGDRDLVPQVLMQSGVQCVFHKVQLRPGKPVWFGVRHDSVRPTLVFGLPGNPVSNLVCCRLFVIPCLQALAGHSVRWDWGQQPAILSTQFVARGHRASFWPGRWSGGHTEVPRQVEPLNWFGSADPFTVARSDCWIYFAEGNRTYAAGATVPVISLDGVGSPFRE
jgi:molybdopterin molybdotransferase